MEVKIIWYKRNCDWCGRTFNTRQEDKKWCNNSRCSSEVKAGHKKIIIDERLD